MTASPEALNREIEFRLAASPEILDRIADLLFPEAKAKRGLRVQNLRAIYYDTEDQRLRRRGLALRVRKNGRKFTQTLKTDSEAAMLFDRREWEVEVGGFEPDFRKFDDPEIADRVGLIFPEELKPLFETDIRRRVGLIDLASPDRAPAGIEVAFDTGAIKAGDQRTEIAEVELELKSGDPRSLFDLARTIREQAPVRLEILDKATRGYRLATGEKPEWSKARKLELAGDMTAEQGLEAVLRAGLDHWLQNEHAAADGSDPEGVHQLRVALRRLRSALSLFRPILVGEARTQWNGRLREILTDMGPARDLDVFEEEMIAPVMAARPEDDALITLKNVATRERGRAQALVREAIQSQAYADTILDLIEWVDRKGWREGAEVDLLIAQRMPLRELATATLDQGHKRVRKKGRDFETIDTEARHEVRIALKKLRYGTEYFASLFANKDTSAYLGAAAKMQDHLGHLNDVAVAERLVGELVAAAKAGQERAQTAQGGGIVIGWYAQLLAMTEGQTVADWRSFEKRDAFWREGKGGSSKTAKGKA